MLEQLGQSSNSAAKSLHVKSALNPMLWLTGIATPLCFACAYFLRDSSPIFEILVFSGLTPILVTCIGFSYFAVFKAEKLQSEDYQIRHESLQIIQQKTGTIEIPLASLDNIVNPRNNLPNTKEEK
ncbi:hypothetical protein [Colwellia sp. Bg11-12]|uniref:hypothetical protein n=1 Tax=Colwellia sp. Bg11-12 TaxID=2759817 RepID=UPI0015F60A6F|nr:hypothetical protein [Colwellia sp. Bg11-12]MBA6263904.1 hypothetical protein [Colwellia sp. Bg11-12]